MACEQLANGADQPLAYNPTMISAGSYVNVRLGTHIPWAECSYTIWSNSLGILDVQRLVVNCQAFGANPS